MSDLVYTTTTGQQPVRPSTQPAVSEAVTIQLYPDLNMVLIGDRPVRAFGMSSEQGVNESDGYISYFKVEGATYLYDVQLYEDRAEVSKWLITTGDTPPSGGDVVEFTSITAFAHFMLKELVPDWEASLHNELIEGM